MNPTTRRCLCGCAPAPLAPIVGAAHNHGNGHILSRREFTTMADAHTWRDKIHTAYPQATITIYART